MAINAPTPIQNSKLQHHRSYRTAMNQLVNPTTQQFLLLSGLKPGMKVLDVGCGLGIMSLWIAEMIGPTGQVTAAETNENYLSIAQEIAAEESITNIRFDKMSNLDLTAKQNQYDFIYSRFFMLRLSTPSEMIQLIYNALHENGIFACESIILGREYCYPHSEPFDKWRQLNAALCAAQGKDPQTGMKLYHLMKQIGFDISIANLLQPVISTPKARKELVYNELAAQIPELIKAKLANEESLTDLLQEIEELVGDTEVFMAHSQSSQVTGTKKP